MRIIKEQINTRTADYITESQAANILQIASGTLRNLRAYRADKDFIPHVRGERRKVFYKKSDVIAYRDKPKKSLRLEHEYPRIPALFNDTPAPNLDPQTKLTTAEAALAFGISKASLQIWRSKHHFLGVLPFHGKHLDIHYLASDLESFILKGRAYWKARSIELEIQFKPHPRSGRSLAA
ncbi:MAG: helix-turn-helix domain-containing protein [Pseudomonas sp.]|uniref:helix-turn-helix domain-containing protein n=1 Tax=Pseudomonas sp. TaxID=306 RepID=UPI003D142405